MRAILSIGFCSFLLLGCGAPVDPVQVDVAALDDAKADATASATVKGLTVTTDGVTVVPNADGHTFIIAGHASKDLASVFSFIADDVFGSADLTGKRTFRIQLSDYEALSIVMGMPLFLTVKPSSGTTSYTAALWLAPRFTAFAGPSGINVAAAMNAVGVGGELQLRGHVSTSFDVNATNLYSDLDIGPSLWPRGPRSWDFDLNWTNLSTIVADGPLFHFAFADKSGGTRSKTAHLGLVVSKLGLTTGDAYLVWPAPSCTAKRQACLDTLPFATLDTAGCGSFAEVRACRLGQVQPVLRPIALEAPIAQELTSAQAAGATVGLTGYGYGFYAAAPPSLAQVGAGYVAFERLSGAGAVQPRTAAQLDAVLAAHHLDGLRAAVEKVVYVNGLDAGEIQVGGGSTAWLLFVPAAARAWVLTL